MQSAKSKFSNYFNGDSVLASYEATEVINLRQDGYRRAGYSFKKGRNELPAVDYQTLLALDCDPFLIVNIIGEPYDENNHHNDHANTGGAADFSTSFENNISIPSHLLPVNLDAIKAPSSAASVKRSKESKQGKAKA